MAIRAWLAVVGLFAVLAPLPACRRFTPAAADREVYGILAGRRGRIPELVGSFDVMVADRIADARRSTAAFVLTLRDALDLAAAASREYRAAREDAYLAALDLTLARNEFRPLFGGGAGGDVALDAGDATLTGRSGGSLSRAFESGGSIVLSLAQDFLRNLSSASPLRLAQSVLRADLFLPLARGSGFAARENLTQAERDAFYAMRDYARFQQGFTVEVATRFYRVLQDRDTAENEEASYASLKDFLDRQIAKGAQGAGRIPEFEVDQARQDVLRTDQRRQSAKARYEASLDAFKLDLGIPVEVSLELLDTDLEELRRLGPLPLPVDEETAPWIAIERRLDLRNARDRHRDALRRVLVARDGLGPQVDLRVSGGLTTPDTRPLALDRVDPDVLLSLDLDLPFERTAERNAWRSSLIQASRSKRTVEATRDRIVLEVRGSLRNLALARRSYDIQLEGVRLAEQRVDNTAMLLEAGTGTTRDRLEAENALVTARNALTGALVDHAVARLELLRDLGTLLVDEDGQWAEPGAAGSAAGTPPASGASCAVGALADAAARPPPASAPPPVVPAPPAGSLASPGVPPQPR